MTSIVIERRRTGWDIALGVLLILGGFIIMGNAILATVLSVLLIGWITLASGVVAVVGALFRIGKPGFWPVILSGGLLTVLGLAFVRNPGVAVLTLTLLAGIVFLASGISRVVGAFNHAEARGVLLISGIISAAFGLIILFNIFAASLVLLGVFLGVQVVMDGVVLVLSGRVRISATQDRYPTGSTAVGRLTEDR